jgi:hypothetical protein
MVAMGLASSLMCLLALWGGFALWYQAPGGLTARSLVIALWVLYCAGMLVLTWAHRPWLAMGPWVGMAGFALAFAAMLVWWGSIKPSNDRIWADDVARTLSGTVEGNRVVLHNVRNFDWRTNTDYTQRWESRSYDLDQLSSVDLITSYWSIPAIAHVLISFGFDDGQHVAFSVEIRREQTEDFSEIGGFFKEFELSIIAADERDVIRVRTNVRGEDDYLYRIQMPAGTMRPLFLAYVGQANGLVATPRFYNTITVNCTTLVYHMMSTIVGHLPLDYRLLLSGYLPSYVYKVGGLDTRRSLQQLHELGRITDRAKAADKSEHFSDEIRAGIPALSYPTVGSIMAPEEQYGRGGQ